MICEEHTTSGNIIVFSTSELLDECDATTEIFTMKMSRNTLELCIYSWPEFVHVFQPFNRDNLFITFHAHCYLQYIHHCSDTCCNMDASQIGYPVGTIITNLQYSLAWYHTILIHKLLQNYKMGSHILKIVSRWAIPSYLIMAGWHTNWVPSQTHSAIISPDTENPPV